LKSDFSATLFPTFLSQKQKRAAYNLPTLLLKAIILDQINYQVPQFSPSTLSLLTILHPSFFTIIVSRISACCDGKATVKAKITDKIFIELSGLVTPAADDSTGSNTNINPKNNCV
jgi:hypothetical protein